MREGASKADRETTAFEVRGGCFEYRAGRPVLRDVSFSVRGGEMLAVLGPNGIGKTTLLKCMMGFQRWTSGVTYLNGCDMAGLPVRDVWRQMAYIPQVKDYSYGFTGLDMAVMGRSSHLGTFSQPGGRDFEIARDAMRRIGIEALADVPCNQMSGGQFQMVLIARALATEPRLLVLDEPETGLDFRNQLVILDVLDDLVHREGLAAVMNTHYPMHALKIADKTLMLGEGCRCTFGPTQQVITEENMRSVFHVEVAFAEARLAGGGRVVRDVVPIEVTV